MENMFHTHNMSNSHASVRAGMGALLVEGGEPSPKAHFVMQLGEDGDCRESFVVMGPKEWAEMVLDMIHCAYHLGGEYQAAMETVLKQPRAPFN